MSRSSARDSYVAKRPLVTITCCCMNLTCFAHYGTLHNNALPTHARRPCHRKRSCCSHPLHWRFLHGHGVRTGELIKRYRPPHQHPAGKSSVPVRSNTYAAACCQQSAPTRTTEDHCHRVVPVAVAALLAFLLAFSLLNYFHITLLEREILHSR